MNPRAPHYKHQSSSASSVKPIDLDSMYGSLSRTFVPASTPTMNSTSVPASTPAPSSTRGTPFSTMSNNTCEPPTHSRSLVKYKPQSSDDEKLLERARGEQQDQIQLQMHTKILRLEDQVKGLLDQRTAFEERQAETEQIIEELRRDVVFLKTQRQQHHDKLDVCKRGVDDNARHAQTLEQRIKAIPGNLEPRFQHHVTRIDKIQSLVRSFGVQIKQHNVQVEQTATAKSRDGSQYGQASEHSGVAQLTSSINKLEVTQDKHESYLQTIGENLFAHQTRMETVNKAIDDVRSKVEILSTVNSGLRGTENSAPKGSLIKMDATTDAIFKLQAKVDRLTEQVRHQGNGAEDPNNDKELLVQMGELRGKINSMERDLGMQAEMQRIMDEIAMAHKLRLETTFYQLTKEYEGRCAPEDIQFEHLDEDQLFMVRQRVLERLSVEDGVQCEFERLKESQQMYS